MIVPGWKDCLDCFDQCYHDMVLQWSMCKPKDAELAIAFSADRRDSEQMKQRSASFNSMHVGYCEVPHKHWKT
jgi:hypothetical protein